MQFQEDLAKEEIIAVLIFGLKTEKLRSTELYDAPLEGSTIFLYRNSLGHTSLKSYRLAELKYAIFSRTGRNSKTYGA